MYQIRAKCKGPVGKTTEAGEALRMIYHSWPELEDSRFGHYSTRRYTHLLKLCIIFAVARLSMEINKQDVIRANTVLAYVETNMPKAIGELGTSRISQASNKIMQVLYEARQPKNAQELFKVVRNDLEKPADLHGLLQNLLMAEKIQLITPVDNGKPGYLPKRDNISRKIMFCDMGYLKGKEMT
jgi:predicted Zn-ribbon and HTH transcriptional regulator